MASRRQFEWDPAKSACNFKRRGFGFEAVTAIFLDPERIEVDTTRAGDREARSKVVGALPGSGGKLFTIVFTMRGGVIRIVSARRANTKEIQSYEDG